MTNKGGQSQDAKVSGDRSGRDLFIVDNSDRGLDGLRYLEEWTGIATAFDIATGLLRDRRPCSTWTASGRSSRRSGSSWAPRSLTGRRRRRCSRRSRAGPTHGHRREPRERRRPSNPFLEGVPAIVEALKSGQIECRVYDRDKFHAKAYITHGEARRGRLAGAGRFEQLHASRSDPERRAEHPDSEPHARSLSSRSGTSEHWEDAD